MIRSSEMVGSHPTTRSYNQEHHILQILSFFVPAQIHTTEAYPLAMLGAAYPSSLHQPAKR